MSLPKRDSIALADAINTELYSGEGLDAFFHLTGCKRQAAIQSCARLNAIARDLPEVDWLVHAVSTFLKNNADEVVKSSLASYLTAGEEHNAMVQARTDQTLQEILDRACEDSGATKLRDCLFLG